MPKRINLQKSELQQTDKQTKKSNIVVQSVPRSERLAINIDDVLRLDKTTRTQLNLAHILDLEQSVLVAEMELAVVFTCPLLQAAITCDIIRCQDLEVKDEPSRIYLLKRTWVNIPSTQFLTVVQSNIMGIRKPILNPKVFPPEKVVVRERINRD